MKKERHKEQTGNQWVKLGLLLSAPLFFLYSCFSSPSAPQKDRSLLPLQCSNNQSGYIDRTGKIVISPQFNEAHWFEDGLAVVKIGSKFGFIDKTGKIVINPQFDQANWFEEGLSVVNIGDKWGYIDKTGKIVINPQFDSVSPFEDGLADVQIGRKFVYIDKTGNVISPSC